MELRQGLVELPRLEKEIGQLDLRIGESGIERDDLPKQPERPSSHRRPRRRTKASPRRKARLPCCAGRPAVRVGRSSAGPAHRSDGQGTGSTGAGRRGAQRRLASLAQKANPRPRSRPRQPNAWRFRQHGARAEHAGASSLWFKRISRHVLKTIKATPCNATASYADSLSCAYGACVWRSWLCGVF